MIKKLCLLMLLVLPGLFPAAPSPAAIPAAAEQDIRSLPIQSGGTVRTFEAYARDIVHEITGELHWQGEDPVETTLRWASDAPAAYTEAIFPLVYEPLRDEIGLSATDPTRLSMEWLVGNDRLVEIATEAQQAQQAGDDLTADQGKVVEVFNRIGALHGLITGTEIRIIPPFAGEAAWRPVTEVMSDTTMPGANVALAWTGLMQAYKRGNAEMITTSARVLNQQLYVWHGDTINPRHLSVELFYRQLDPWTLAKGLYLGTILLAIAAAFIKRPWADLLPRLFLIAGFLVHTGGLGLRWYIGGRAPWSNMYESLTTAAWGAVFFGQFRYRGAASKLIAPAAAFVGFTSLFIAGHHSLDPAINPLVPALQSYWLNIHVIVILLGYASATFAAVLGHVWLANDVFRPQSSQKLLLSLHAAIYRMVQLAVLFLIVGILLGSVWAHSAWGRYWGWDPKETWALITWIYYLSLIHAGYAGWMQMRGLAVASVSGFLLVLMTYYGVNYFLSGLHTYASGSAYTISPAIIGFVVFELLILAGYGIHRYLKSRAAREAGKQQDPALESQ